MSEEKIASIPEGKLVTMLVNGVETAYEPGRADAQYVLTDKLTEQCSSFTKRGIEPYRAAIFVGPEGVDESKSVTSAVQGGSFDNAGAEGITITSTSDDFTGIMAVGGKYTLKNSTLKFITRSDGKHVCDFSGYGSLLSAFQDAHLTVEHCNIESVGVAKAALFADDRSDCLFKDCNVTVRGGTLYDGYVNSANQKVMVAPPWVLGITGNARGINLEGDRGTAYLVNCSFKANQWGVLSTDSGQDLHLYVVDSDMILLGENVSASDARDPYARKYGSGYGSYIFCNAAEEFYGAHIKVGCMGVVLRGGSALYASSRGEIRLVSPVSGETVYEGPGKGRATLIEAECFGAMAHGEGTITFTDGTEVDAGDAVFLIKAGDVTCNVTDGAILKSGSGVILQLMDDDDKLVGAKMTDSGPMFNTEFNERPGWPSENGQITAKMPAPADASAAGNADSAAEPPKLDNFFYAENVALKGNLYNGTGYFGQPGRPLFVTLGKGVTLDGAISATEIMHINEKGEQNTHFTIKEYYYLGHVTNRIFFNGDNIVEVTLKDGAVWNVTGTGIISKLTVGEGCTVNGRVTENADGTLTVSPN